MELMIRSLMIICALVIAPWSISAQSQETININSAPVEGLMRLPGVGRTVASRIVQFRAKHGPFKRPQEIIVIKGMNARRYREIAHLIRI
jgi:competence protein ComEA